MSVLQAPISVLCLVLEVDTSSQSEDDNLVYDSDYFVLEVNHTDIQDLNTIIYYHIIAGLSIVLGLFFKAKIVLYLNML